MRNDTVVQAWVQRKTLANITKFYLNNGVTPKTRSELIRMATEDFETILINNGLEPIENIEEAKVLMDRVYPDIAKDIRGRKSLFDNMQSTRFVDDKGEVIDETTMKEALKLFQQNSSKTP